MVQLRDDMFSKIKKMPSLDAVVVDAVQKDYYLKDFIMKQPSSSISGKGEDHEWSASVNTFSGRKGAREKVSYN